MRNGKDWILTATGKRFYLMEPAAEEVSILDIARALSKICRFGGHCREFYSVAQHSVMVSRVVNREFALPALLHDAPEAYVGDMVRPLKYLLPDYRACEDRIWLAICQQFRINPELHPSIKAADNTILMTERRDLMPESGHEWSLARDYPPLANEFINPLPPQEAERMFINRWAELSGVAQPLQG